MARSEVWGLAREISPEMCQDIIDECQKFPLESGKLADPANSSSDVVRDSYVRWVESSRIMALLDHYARTANRESFGVDIDRTFTAQFTEYHGEYTHHFDWHGDTMWTHSPLAYDRKITTIIQLSPRSEYEGGELKIANLNLDEGLREQGSVIVFLSFLSHKVEPVTSGVRNSLVAWAEGPTWR